jgi:hypothetical protein
MVDLQLKEVVKARLRTMPEHWKVHSGSDEIVLDRDAILSHIDKEDEIGAQFIENELAYMKAWKNKVSNDSTSFNNLTSA